MASAALIVGHAVVHMHRERDIVRRLSGDYDRVQRRAVQLVADLGGLAAGQYELWMVDLYVVKRRWHVQKSWQLVTRVDAELVRAVSVSLVDARPQPPTIAIDGPAHGECFAGASPLLWFDPAQLSDPVPENPWPRYPARVNTELAEVYGVLAAYPIVDQLDKNCVGVLAVHVAPSADAVVKALGVLRSDTGKRRVRDAAIDLNGWLSP